MAEIRTYENKMRPLRSRHRSVLLFSQSDTVKEFFGPTEKSSRKKAFRWLEQQRRIAQGMKKGETLVSVHGELEEPVRAFS